jgi:hypothetical protein
MPGGLGAPFKSLLVEEDPRSKNSLHFCEGVWLDSTLGNFGLPPGLASDNAYRTAVSPRWRTTAQTAMRMVAWLDGLSPANVSKRHQ